MLTVETTDVDPEGNESIWFGGKVIIGDSFLHFDLGFQKIVYCKSSVLQLCRSYDLVIHHLPSLRLFASSPPRCKKGFATVVDAPIDAPPQLNAFCPTNATPPRRPLQLLQNTRN